MLLKILLISLFAGICGLDGDNTLIHFHRPIVAGAIVGLILGDFQKGLIVGGTLELVFLGVMPIGGAQPPNSIIGGILGTAFAILTNVDAKIAIGIAVPFSIAVQAASNLVYTGNAGFIHKADKYALEGNTKGVDNMNLAGMIPMFIFYFLFAFVPLYFGAGAAQSVINAIPAKIMEGIQVAGGMMPAVGFAILLRTMIKKDLIIFLGMGFILVAYLKLPIIGVALIAVIIAAYTHFIGKSNNENKEVTSDGI
jgi:PTS system N-acetylgalactosamine-specific IIC component